MAHVTPAEVQQWIRNTRLAITSIDATKDETFTGIAFAKLVGRYTTTTWVDATTTPDLVRTCISMLYAAYEINAGNAEATNEINNYANHLESSAMALLGGLADGSISLSDFSDVGSGAVSHTAPEFWPTRMATLIAETDGWDAAGAAPLAFRMGKVF